MSAHEFAVAPIDASTFELMQQTGTSTKQLNQGNFALLAFDFLDIATGDAYDRELEFVTLDTLPPTTRTHARDTAVHRFLLVNTE